MHVDFDVDFIRLFDHINCIKNVWQLVSWGVHKREGKKGGLKEGEKWPGPGPQDLRQIASTDDEYVTELNSKLVYVNSSIPVFNREYVTNADNTTRYDHVRARNIGG